MKNIIKHALRTLILISSVALTSCYSWFETKVVYDTNSTPFSLQGFFSEVVVQDKLDTPAQVIVSKGLYSDRIALTWQAVPNAKSYRIERAVVNAGDAAPDESMYENVRGYVYATTYEDKILEKPTPSNEAYSKVYYYRICAENIGKGLAASDYTDPSKDMTDGVGYLLPPPSSVGAWKGKSIDTVKVTWDPVENAESYIIFRGEKENGTGMEQIGSATGNKLSYENAILSSEQGKEFFYKVQAVTSSGSSSILSSLAMGYSLTEGAPVAPDNVTVENALGTGDGYLTVKWDEVSNVNPSEKTYTYSLYRTSSADSVFTPIKNGIESSTTSYQDKNTKPGVYYYYYLQTVSKNNTTGETEKSPFSESGPDSTTPAMGFMLSAPLSVEVADSETAGKVKLLWTPAIGSEISGTDFSYKIYTADNESDAFILLATVDPETEADVITKTDDGLYCMEIESKKYFKLSTVNDANGTESLQSKTAAPTPEAPTNVVATKTANIEGAMTPNPLSVYPVKITWTAAKDAEGYYVYRATSETGPFRKISDSPVKETSFIDSYEGAKPGTFYFYKVISLNSLLQGNKGNDPATDVLDGNMPFKKCCGYGAITREQFLREYNKTIRSSQKKLTYMNKSNDFSKIGTETINGAVSGTLYYNAGLSGYVTMTYTNYADTYVCNNSAYGPYFIFDGNTNTKIEGNLTEKNGHMEKTNTASTEGMYPGYVIYDNLEIKGGAAGGGYYIISTQDKSGKTILAEDHVDWTVGEE